MNDTLRYAGNEVEEKWMGERKKVADGIEREILVREIDREHG